MHVPRAVTRSPPTPFPSPPAPPETDIMQFDAKIDVEQILENYTKMIQHDGNMNPNSVETH